MLCQELIQSVCIVVWWSVGVIDVNTVLLCDVAGAVWLDHGRHCEADWAEE